MDFADSIFSLFQSTLPRRERHGVEIMKVISKISIHAPAKGATIYTDGEPYIRVISIHAPAKGATHSRINL